MKYFVYSILLTILVCVSCVAIAENCPACKQTVPPASNFCIYCGQPVGKIKNLYIQGHSWANDAKAPTEKKLRNGVELTVNELGSMLGYSSNPLKLKKNAIYHLSFKVESGQTMILRNRFAHNVSPWTIYHEDSVTIQANTVRECVYVVKMNQNDDAGELAIVFEFTDEWLKKIRFPFKLRIYDIIISEIL